MESSVLLFVLSLLARFKLRGRTAQELRKYAHHAWDWSLGRTEVGRLDFPRYINTDQDHILRGIHHQIRLLSFHASERRWMGCYKSRKLKRWVGKSRYAMNILNEQIRGSRNIYR